MLEHAFVHDALMETLGYSGTDVDLAATDAALWYEPNPVRAAMSLSSKAKDQGSPSPSAEELLWLEAESLKAQDRMSELAVIDNTLESWPQALRRLIGGNVWQAWEVDGRPSGARLRHWLKETKEKAESSIDSQLSLPAVPTSADVAARYSYIDELLGGASHACLRVMVRRYWSRFSVAEAFPDPVGGEPAAKQEQARLYPARFDSVADPLGNGRWQAIQNWLCLAEDFIAIEVVAYLSRFFVQLKFLARCLVWGPLLAILAIVSYPFHPQRLLLLVAGFFIVAVAAAGIWVFIRIEKNEVVSRILKTTPNRLNFSWEFIRSVTLALVPLLGLLAAASSDLSNLLHTLLDPLYGMFK